MMSTVVRLAQAVTAKACRILLRTNGHMKFGLTTQGWNSAAARELTDFRFGVSFRK